jgi:hypothetical protein
MRQGEVRSEVEEVSPTDDRFGFFYLIQLVPEALPNGIKIGFADNVDRRLDEHKTAAPTAKMLKSWPCKRSWDYAAMASITREAVSWFLMRCSKAKVQGFIDRGDRFFAMMPTPDSERELSGIFSALRIGWRPNRLIRGPATPGTECGGEAEQVGVLNWGLL